MNTRLTATQIERPIIPYRPTHTVMGKSGKPGGWKGRNEKRALARAAARALKNAQEKPETLVQADGMHRVDDAIDVRAEKHKHRGKKIKHGHRKA